MDRYIAGSLLTWSIQGHREDVEILPVVPLLVGAARKNDKRPARFDMSVPDDWVKNAAGDEELRDVYLVCRVPREHFLEWHRKSTEPATEADSAAPPEEAPAP